MGKAASKKRKQFVLPESQAIDRCADAVGEVVMFVILGGLVGLVYMQEVEEKEEKDGEILTAISYLRQV